MSAKQAETKVPCWNVKCRDGKIPGREYMDTRSGFIRTTEPETCLTCMGKGYLIKKEDKMARKSSGLSPEEKKERQREYNRDYYRKRYGKGHWKKTEVEQIPEDVLGNGKPEAKKNLPAISPAPREDGKGLRVSLTITGGIDDVLLAVRRLRGLE